MSRHGTYVGRKKIPPHDPFLLHGECGAKCCVRDAIVSHTHDGTNELHATEGDIIKFGQSIRMYILKGATTDGASAPKKKSWGRVKLRAPKVSITGVLPKMPSRPKVSAPVAKLVNEVSYGTLSDEKLDAFVTAVLELSDDERKVGVRLGSWLRWLDASAHEDALGVRRRLRTSSSRRSRRSSSSTLLT